MPRKRKIVKLPSGAIDRSGKLTPSNWLYKLELKWLPTCEQCGEKFVAYGNQCAGGGRKARYCSAACRKAKSRVLAKAKIT